MKRNFTLMELLIVAIILALTSAFALPRLLAYPHRIMVENALTNIRTAFSETAMRSRATGIPLSLQLDLENNCFQVEECPRLTVNDWEPPMDEEALENARNALQIKSSYPLSSQMEWLSDAEEVQFRFFPDGQAVGNAIQFQIGSQQFQFDVDRLSGNALIMELNPR